MGFGGSRTVFPKGVKSLILVNIIVFVLVELSGVKYPLFQNFGMVPSMIWDHLKLWQLVTYMFLHANFMHILINMFVLWMFGSELENRWGRSEFLKYYFITGIGAGLITAIFNFNSTIPVVGASGAIYGLLLAYGLMYPNRKVYVYFFIPVKMKFLVIMLAAVAFFASLSPGASPISHLTHLSGMVIGYIFLRSDFLTGFFRKSPKHSKAPSQSGKSVKPPPEKVFNESLIKRRVDDVLDKMQQVGWEGLSQSEQNILHDASKKFSRDQPPN